MVNAVNFSNLKNNFNSFTNTVSEGFAKTKEKISTCYQTVTKWEQEKFKALVKQAQQAHPWYKAAAVVVILGLGTAAALSMGGSGTNATHTKTDEPEEPKKPTTKPAVISTIPPSSTDLTAYRIAYAFALPLFGLWYGPQGLDMDISPVLQTTVFSSRLTPEQMEQFNKDFQNVKVDEELEELATDVSSVKPPFSSRFTRELLAKLQQDFQEFLKGDEEPGILSPA